MRFPPVLTYVKTALRGTRSKRLRHQPRMKTWISLVTIGWMALDGLGLFRAAAQILLSSGGYTQNFDTLAVSGTANAWADNSTLPGWYAARVSGGAITTYRSDNGVTGALYSYGVVGVSNVYDRALGSTSSGTPGTIAYGVRFTNDTAATLTQFQISYTGEQWRNGGNTSAQSLTFSYRVSATPITSADAANANSWTSFPALDFITPTVGSTSATLDGNATANRQTFANVLLAGVSVAPGQEIFFRWSDVNDVGNDHGFGVDDLSITFQTGTAPAPAAPTFSLLTYNVKGNGATNWSTNAVQVQAIARQLQYLLPDAITFNEIPWDLRYEMTNFMATFLPGYQLAVSSGTDGSICSAIATRHPITRASKWLDGIDLRSFGYSNVNNALDNFTRDLFEAQIAVPGFVRPVHVFTTHLKATASGEYAENAAKRAAEAAAITNFFATNLLTLHPYDLYVLTGDLNASDTNELCIQKLLSPPTGLTMTLPKNPVTGSVNTYSTASANPSSRLDYIFPGPLLYSNLKTSLVFRTDKLTPLPPGLNSDDSQIASDHYPVLMVFNNPYDKPFKLLSVTRSAPTVTLQWESVLGQPYRVEISSNLTAWTALANQIVATDTSFTFTTNLSATPQFFRLYRLPSATP